MNDLHTRDKKIVEGHSRQARVGGLLGCPPHKCILWFHWNDIFRKVSRKFITVGKRCHPRECRKGIEHVHWYQGVLKPGLAVSMLIRKVLTCFWAWAARTMLSSANSASRSLYNLMYSCLVSHSALSIHSFSHFAILKYLSLQRGSRTSLMTVNLSMNHWIHRTKIHTHCDAIDLGAIQMLIVLV